MTESVVAEVAPGIVAQLTADLDLTFRATCHKCSWRQYERRRRSADRALAAHVVAHHPTQGVML